MHHSSWTHSCVQVQDQDQDQDQRQENLVSAAALGFNMTNTEL